MKKAVLILVLLIIPILYYLGVFSREDSHIYSIKEFFSVESPDPVERRWDVKSNAALNKTDLDNLYQLKLDRGFRNVPVLSLFLIRESDKARKEGDADQAVLLARYSEMISPDLSQPYFAMARALWSQRFFSFQGILSEVLKGETVRFQYYPSALRFYYDLYYLFANAVLLAFLVFGAVVIIKYFPLFFYDIQKNMNRETLWLLLNGLKIIVLFIPFFLRLDILWSILFWCILLWGYVKKDERKFIVVLLIVLVYFPFSLRLFSSALDKESSEIILDINRINHEDGDKATEEQLRAWVAAHPDDSEALFTLGLADKRRGRYSEAEEWYRKAIQQDPKFSDAYNNLGNVSLVQKQIPAAIEFYQQAIDLDPGQGAYYYNLYRAYSQDSYLSGKADKSFQRAQQLDPQLVNTYTGLDNPNRPLNYNRYVADQSITSSILWGRFWGQFAGKGEYLVKAWIEKIPSNLPAMAPFIFLGFLIGMSRYCRSKRFLTRCPMCGVATHRFYMGSSDQEFICFNCYRIFIQKEKMHLKIIEKKTDQTRHFQKQNHWVNRIVSLFFVGFGDLWREKTVRGLVLLSIFFVFVLRFIHWDGSAPQPFPQISPSVWRWIFWGVLFVLYYFIVILYVYRLKPYYNVDRLPLEKYKEVLPPDEGKLE